MESYRLLDPERLQDTEEVYKAPIVEIIEVKVERGFSDSKNNLSDGPDEKGGASW